MSISSKRKPAGRINPALGRDRVRRPDSARRAPMAVRVPRPAKRRAGKTESSAVPAHIQDAGTGIDAEDRAYVRRKLGMKLGKFAGKIERVSVRISDVNGPRGGTDKACAIKVVLSGMPSVLVLRRHASLQAAMDGALRRVESAVRRGVQRRRTRAR